MYAYNSIIIGDQAHGSRTCQDCHGSGTCTAVIGAQQLSYSLHRSTAVIGTQQLPGMPWLLYLHGRHRGPCTWHLYLILIQTHSRTAPLTHLIFYITIGHSDHSANKGEWLFLGVCLAAHAPANSTPLSPACSTPLVCSLLVLDNVQRHQQPPPQHDEQHVSAER